MFLGIAAATQQPTSLVLSFCAIAFITSLLTSTLFVFGPPDAELKTIRAKTENDLSIKRQQVAVFRDEARELREQAVIRRKAERAQENEEEVSVIPDHEVQTVTQRSSQKSRRVRTCPYCRERIDSSAVKCPNCLEYLDPRLARQNQVSIQLEQASTEPQSNPGIAAVLSFLIPGLGQIYKRQVLGGLFWFFTIYMGCFLSILLIPACGIGLIGLPVVIVLYLICIFDAASSS